MLLYLIKYSRPDLCKAVRELLKCMDKATIGTYQEMIHVIKFVLDTKMFCLQTKPNFDSKKSCNLKVFSDSDWAGDSEIRIGAPGFIFYLQNIPVCWRSKAQRGIILSRSEAEYIAVSESVKEIRFIYFILCDIGIEVELPIVAETGTVGAMFLTQTSSAGVQNWHVDTRYNFVCKIVEVGIVKVEFVKNVSQETHERHAIKFWEY
jgi:hypothetical protein